LAFLLAALNDLEILGGDIGNAYLQAKTKEKVHTICGPEFGHALQGQFAIICRALYGLKFLKETIRNLELDLKKIDKRLPGNKPTPLSSGYRPELDVSAPLDDDYVSWYQKLIGALRWAVELGRIDIHLSVALLLNTWSNHRQATWNKCSISLLILRGTLDQKLF
jgi:hypothetical protein